MEDWATYQTEAPKGPRNLARFIAEWLRTQGFTATEVEKPAFATVNAHWLGSQGERFELGYTWASGPVPESTCRLRVRYPGQLTPDILFTAQHVRRLKEARLLLTNCVRYHNARLLSKLATTTAP